MPVRARGFPEPSYGQPLFMIRSNHCQSCGSAVGCVLLVNHRLPHNGPSYCTRRADENKEIKCEKDRVVHDIAVFFIELPQDYQDKAAYSTARPSFSIKTLSAM